MRVNLLMLFMVIAGMSNAQTYSLKGRIVDDFQNPVDYTGCMLHSLTDTLFSKSTVSNVNGIFEFEGLSNGVYKLYLTHVSYEHMEIPITINNHDLIIEYPYILEYKNNILDEFVISVERPLVRVVDNKFVYNTSVIKESKVVSNAFDLLRHIPNITGVGDNLRLVGTNGYAILIDGKPTTLSNAEIIRALKSMPASRVADIEIMYSAPPQYSVRGAAINIVLDHDEQPEEAPLQGELVTEYHQGYYPGYGIRSNLLYNRPAFKVDLNIGYRGMKEWNRNTIDAVHPIQDDRYDVSLDDKKTYRLSAVDLRLNMIRMFEDNSSLSMTYTADLARREGGNSATATFLRNGDLYSDMASRADKKIHADLHNVRLDYMSSKNLSVGVDYTSYHDPTEEIYRDFDAIQQEKQTEYKTTSRQNIHRVLAYAGHSVNLGEGWSLNYGARGNYSANRNNYDYFGQLSTSNPDSLSHTRQQEYNYSGYAGFSKSFGERLHLQASFSGGMYRGTLTTAGKTETLWNNFEPFVNVNISYIPSEKHIWQLSFSSDVEYPPYWALSNNGFRLNTYSVLLGNPSLKFARKYNTQLVYVINNKYTIVGYNNYIPDYISQLPYQSSERLENRFQMVNLDYQNMYGIVGMIPFRAGKFMESQLTLNFFRQTEKDSDFNELSFKNSHNSFIVQIDNSFNISSNPSIKGELSAFYLSGAMQGIFTIQHYSNVTAGVKWQSRDRRMEVGAQLQDIFNASSVTMKTNYENQNLRMVDFADTPFFRFTFTYRFGNYSKKEREEIDISRFNR